MRLFLPLAFSILVSACGTVSSVKAPVHVPATTSFTFLDQRPAEQRVSRSPDKSEGEAHFGDDAITPSAADMFKATLERRAGNALRGTTVTLTDLVVTVKDPAVSVDEGRLNTAAASVPGGGAAAPLAGLLILGIEKARSQKWVYVRVRGLVGQKEFSAYQNDRYGGRVTEANIMSTLTAVMEMAARDAEEAALPK